MNKYEVFSKEIEYIVDFKYRENIKVLLNLLPDYFYEIPASSTGKYHPKYAASVQGLVKHTKVAVRIANELLNNNVIGSSFSRREKDLMLMSLLLHDGLKSGFPKQKYTAFDHPILVANFIRDNKDKLTLTNDEVEFIAQVIETHMGEWNTNPYSKVVLPLPKNKWQKFVHMCDFLASKKFLEVPFVDNDIMD